MKRSAKVVGVLTSGGDCPGLNAVIRALTKSLAPEGVKILRFLEGFTGLVEKRYVVLEDDKTSGLLTQGGTIIRTSRNKPHKMPQADGGYRDMTEEAVANYRKTKLDCLICLGGGGTQQNAYRLMEAGDLNVITAPKTIDNDVWGTDICFGFDTGMHVVTEAIDRLHTTASSHHRVIVVEIMGHNAGWLALGAGIAGGADVILIPEIPYDLDIVAQSLLARMRRGKMFSIVAVAEGALTKQEVKSLKAAKKSGKHKGNRPRRGQMPRAPKELISAILAEHIEKVTGLETRVTSLGYVQRGGIPTPTDRLLSTKFGTMAAEFVREKRFGIMVAKQGQQYVATPLEEIVGKRRVVPLDHAWLHAARSVGTCLGDVVPHGYTAP